MNIGNCPECGKLYVKTAAGMCPDCYRLEEEKQAVVAEYVRDHPKSSVEEIHEATGVKEKTIFRMIKSGRFVDSLISYPCEMCGQPISEGRFCLKCNQNLIQQVKEAEAKRVEKEKTLAKTIENKQDKQVQGKGMYTKNM